MPSAIEIYREAYDRDYRKGDWEYAEQLYKKIIEQYPYSEEKEYAQVHLERLARLKADPHHRPLQAVHSKSGPSGLAIFTFIVTVVVAAATAGMGYLLWVQNGRINYQNALLEGMLSERVGDSDAAVSRFQEAQAVRPESSLAYRLLAELYLGQRRFELAEIERRRWEVIDPADPALADFGARMRQAMASQAEGATE